jgi:hypothetical protein
MQTTVITQPGFFDLLGPKAQPIPGILLVFADEFLEAQAEKKLHGIKTGRVHMTQNRQHHARGHAVGPQANVAIAQCRIDHPNVVHLISHLDQAMAASTVGCRSSILSRPPKSAAA